MQQNFPRSRHFFTATLGPGLGGRRAHAWLESPGVWMAQHGAAFARAATPSAAVAAVRAKGA